MSRRVMTFEATKRMSVLEWIAAGAAVVLAVAVGSTPCTMSALFIELFRDYGTLDELPFVTQLVLRRTFAWTHALVTVVLIVGALVATRSVRRRRIVLITGLAVSLLGVGIYIFGIYSPLFEMTDIASP